MMSELGPEEREAELGALRKRLRKAGRRGDRAEYERLSREYTRLKDEHVTRTHEEYVAERRAARVAQRALRAQEEAERPGPWRLPPGFSSPLAAQRARSGWRPREEPVAPPGGLRPWRRGGGLMSEVIWRPGR
jgi:hypothetical protein